MAEDVTETAPVAAGSQRLALLLAAAMFVLVVDTSLMNVSIWWGKEGARGTSASGSS